jgi:hypothetical protein
MTTVASCGNLPLKLVTSLHVVIVLDSRLVLAPWLVSKDTGDLDESSLWLCSRLEAPRDTCRGARTLYAAALIDNLRMFLALARDQFS